MASTPDPPPAGEAPPPGGRGGEYQVGALLRSGWGGPIHDGLYLRTGHRVTVQVVRPELTAGTGFTPRLAVIGRAVAAIRDPSLLALYDMVETGDGLQLIAEWSEAVPLNQAAGVGTIAAGRAARIVDGVLAGLVALHQAGMFHGNVNRATVVVGSDGSARLAELAVCAAAARPGSGPAGDLQATARLGLGLLPRGHRQEGMRRVLAAVCEAASPAPATEVRAAFAEAAAAALGASWQQRRQVVSNRRRRLAALLTAAVLVAGLGVAAGLVLFGGGGSHATSTGPLALGADATLTVAPDLGGCNTTFVFVGRGSLRGAGTLVYRWEQSDGQSSADTPLKITADDGSFQLTQAWRLQGAQTVDGAMTLHILQPTELSLKRSFRYACS